MKLGHLCVGVSLAATLLLFAGCWALEPDVTVPAVMSVEPADGTLHTSIAAVVSIVFSEEVDSATVSADTVSITDFLGNAVPGSWSAGSVASFTPDHSFAYGCTYIVGVTSGVTDLAGNALEPAFNSTFTTRAVPVVGGRRHALAVTDDGSVWAWGDNGSWQLGDGTNVSSTPPIPVDNAEGTGVFTDAVAVAAGHYHSVALKSDGTVWAWGSNSSGQLGDGTLTTRERPVQVKGLGGAGWLSDIVAISANYYQSFALASDGTVWGWGDNGDDQIADIGAGSTPTPVQAFADALAVSSGILHTLALKSDGTVWAWGMDEYGELGAGAGFVAGFTVPVPAQVVGPGGTGFLTDIAAISAGDYVSSAVKADGTVWTWGDDMMEQLGDGAGATEVSAPVQVLSSDGTGFLTGITGVDAGYMHMTARKNDGTSWSWGFNQFGQMGVGTTANSPGVALPVQTHGTDGVGLLAGVSGVAASCYQTSYAALADGTIRGWGGNDYGELGVTTTEMVDSTWYISSVPVQTDALDLIP